MEVNIVLFDDFETLDAFGPAQIFGKALEHFHSNYLSGKYYSCSDSICSFDIVLSVIADLADTDAAVKAAACLGYKWDLASEEGIIM